MKIKMLSTLNKGKPSTGNIRGLNLTEVILTTVTLTQLLL